MVEIITTEVARARDRIAQEKFHIPAELLMEDAGVRAAEEIGRCYPRADTILVVIGRGNNGGDGVVVARQLFALGKNVHIFSLYPPSAFSPLLEKQHQIARALQIPIHNHSGNKTYQSIGRYVKGLTVIVDAILGTGSHGKLRDPEKSVISAINRIQRENPNATRIVSLDIPSGLDATTGKSLGTCIFADRTITFDLPKRGLFQNDGSKHAGRVVVASIGLPCCAGDACSRAATGIPSSLSRHQHSKEHWITPEMVTAILHEPHPTAHKGDRGKVLIIAGSRGMAGAAILCSRSALRAGAGVVYLAVPEEIQNSVNTANPEVITVNVEEIDVMRSIISRVDSVAIGPGLGLSKDTEERLHKLYPVIEKNRSHINGVVVDADGLFLLETFLRTPKSRKIPWIITPHAGEFSKLAGSKNQYTAPAFSKKTQTTLVLKGAHTTIINGGKETYRNSTGNAGMATAGSGDVLTGMIGSYLAQGYSPIHSTILGVYLHGECGDILKRSVGRIGFTSHDLLDTIPKAMEKQFAF